MLTAKEAKEMAMEAVSGATELSNLLDKIKERAKIGYAYYEPDEITPITLSRLVLLGYSIEMPWGIKKRYIIKWDK